MNEKSLDYMVSVRLMTYNHEKFIAQALEGILMQKTNFPIEVIIGDDFSSDRTIEIIKKFNDSEKIHLKLLDREVGDDYWQRRKKFGRLYNFFDILTKCNGKYIALLDGDDYWNDEYKLQKQIDFLEENKNYVITFHDVDVVNEKNELIKSDRIRNQKEIREKEDLIGGADLPTNTVVFRNILKSIPGEFFSVNNGDTFLFALLGHYGKGYQHF